MIVFCYSKTDGAEFISHLDTLRHIQKTLKRANVDVNKSLGFAKRPIINMSSPIGVGQQTTAEYCYVETEIDCKDFERLFNDYSPKYIKCVKAYNVSRKCNVAGIIDGAEYEIKGLTPFDVNEVLSLNEFVITDKKGREKDVRNKIQSLSFTEDGTLKAILTAGNDTLRADLFSERLKEIYGGEHIKIFKTKSFIGKESVDEVLRRDYA